MSREISDITITSAPVTNNANTQILMRNSTTGALEERDIDSIPNATGSGVFGRWTENNRKSSIPALAPGDSLSGTWPDLSNSEDTWYPIYAVSGVGVNFSILLQNTDSNPHNFQVCEIIISTKTLSGTALYTSAAIPANSLAYYTFTVTPTSTGLQTWMFIQNGNNDDLKLWSVS